MKSLCSFLRKLFFTTLIPGALHVASLRAEEEAKKASPYPLETCVVSGNPLGTMGPPFIIKHNGTEVRFCCEGCVKDFNQDPEKYLKQLHTSPQQ